MHTIMQTQASALHQIHCDYISLAFSHIMQNSQNRIQLCFGTGSGDCATPSLCSILATVIAAFWYGNGEDGPPT